MRSDFARSRLFAGLLLVTLAPAGVGAAGIQGRGQALPGGGRGGGQGRGGTPARDPRSAGETPAGTAAIAGTIVVAGTGAPARRARVTLNGDTLGANRAVIADDEGRYAFAGLPAGRFTLSASKLGHLPVTYGQRVPGSGRPGTPIQLEDGQRLTIRLQMPRGGVIAGTVLDEHGEPAVGAQVRVYRYNRQNGVRTPQVAGNDATDDRGMYRVYGLQIGDYLVAAIPRPQAVPGSAIVDRIQEAVSALAPQGAAGSQISATVLDRLGAAQAGAAQPQSTRDEPATGYAPVFYPGTSNTGAATTIALNAGEERLGVDFQLQLVTTARVEGMVVFPGNQEAGGVNVQLVNSGDDLGGMGGGSARIDRNGHFTFNDVAPGQYQLLARTGGPGPMGPAFDALGGRGGRGAPGADGQPERGGRGSSGARLWAATEIAVDGKNVSDIVLALQPAFSMSGRIEFKGAAAQTPSDLTRMRVSLTPSDPGGSGRTLAAAAPGRVDETGRFTIDGIVPGRYRVSAGGATGWTLESAIVGGQDALDFPLDIRSSQNLAGAVVTFTDQQTTVTGTVTNSQGQAVSDYTLIVYPTDQRYWLPQSRRIRSIRPATDGTFTLTGLPAGDYRIAPELDPEPGSWFDATFLQQLDGTSERFSLTDGEKKTLSLKAGS